MSEVRVLTAPEVRSLITPADALGAVRDAFVALHRGRATLPEVLGLDLPERHGEAHVKGAYLHGAPLWSIKAATGFYDNPARGLPATSGLSLVFSAETGVLDTLLFDGGYLTELRTGAAGAVAADLLAPRDVRRALIVGTGGQARYQLEALLGVRTPATIAVWGRRGDAARAYAVDVRARLGVEVEVEPDLAAAVRAADLVVTTTPSRVPVIDAGWLAPGVHVTAMGADMPEKRELGDGVLRHAGLVAVDDVAQAVTQGEAHHAVAAGELDAARLVTLGAIAAGDAPGRTAPDQVTVADLTGLGVQDAAVANLVVDRARAAGIGRMLSTE